MSVYCDSQCDSTCSTILVVNLNIDSIINRNGVQSIVKMVGEKPHKTTEFLFLVTTVTEVTEMTAVIEVTEVTEMTAVIEVTEVTEMTAVIEVTEVTEMKAVIEVTQVISRDNGLLFVRPTPQNSSQ